MFVGKLFYLTSLKSCNELWNSRINRTTIEAKELFSSGPGKGMTFTVTTWDNMAGIEINPAEGILYVVKHNPRRDVDMFTGDFIINVLGTTCYFKAYLDHIAEVG